MFSFGAMAAGKLNLYNWADYTPDELIKKFEAETHAKGAERERHRHTFAHTKAQTPTCTTSRGTVASEVGNFAATMSPHAAF